MNLDKLYVIIEDSTVQYRKGQEIEEKKIGGLKVVNVYAMPHKTEMKNDLIEVDVHFMTIGVDKAKAEQHRKELISILKDYPDPDRLAGGPSYIELGGVIGDQGSALRLFALGQVLELWTVITPKTLGIVGEEAQKLAGMGMIMISGFKEIKK